MDDVHVSTFPLVNIFLSNLFKSCVRNGLGSKVRRSSNRKYPYSTEDFEVDITYVYYWGIIYYIFELCTHLLGFLSFIKKYRSVLPVVLHVVYL